MRNNGMQANGRTHDLEKNTYKANSFSGFNSVTVFFYWGR